MLKQAFIPLKRALKVKNMMHMSVILEVLGQQGASVCPSGLCNLIQFACSTVQNANRVETRATQHKVWFLHLFKHCVFSAVDKNTVQTSLTTPATVQEIFALQYGFVAQENENNIFLHPFLYFFYLFYFIFEGKRCFLSHTQINK